MKSANLPSNFLYTIVTLNQLHPTASFCFAEPYLCIGHLCLQTTTNNEHILHTNNTVTFINI